MIEEIHAVVRGRVQLVMFRDFVQRKATSLGITGTARNMKDGSVEIYAQGEEKKLDAFVLLLQEGPVLAKVDDVIITPIADLVDYNGFSIIY